ncbi:hypothetical protein ASPCAL15067 [Aspergillus calidoustus]|uniref:Uncharacterized protein n=1 Tax=Aspergillus calidoustus TaxID=454130 RepID=A0A0U4ZRJ0_ASPCI|nr:hypothetical protein ASPCAL15067 [Aspergillus calidoustus]
MRRNRCGQLARIASDVPWWPVGDPMARDADTVTPWLSPVCARQSICNQVTAIVQPNSSDDLRLLDLDVEPCRQWSSTDTTVADTTGPTRNHVQWIASRKRKPVVIPDDRSTNGPLFDEQPGQFDSFPRFPLHVLILRTF